MSLVCYALGAIIVIQVVDLATCGWRYERKLRAMNPGYTGDAPLSSVLRRVSIDP